MIILVSLAALVAPIIAAGIAISIAGAMQQEGNFYG
jgi:hypothetical protein